MIGRAMVCDQFANGNFDHGDGYFFAMSDGSVHWYDAPMGGDIVTGEFRSYGVGNVPGNPDEIAASWTRLAQSVGQ
jgi:hypothetical protein